MQMKAQSDIHGALDSIDANLAITLGGVRVASGKERTGILYRQIKRGTGAKLAHVHIPAEDAGRASAEFALFRRGNTHNAAEGPQRHDRGSKRMADISLEFPDEKIRVGEPVL